MTTPDAAVTDDRRSLSLSVLDEALAEDWATASAGGSTPVWGGQAVSEQDASWCRLVRRLWVKDRWAAAPGAPPFPRPGTRLGRFEIRRELGRGSFGVVFLAHDPELRREVAIKVLRPDLLQLAGFAAGFESSASERQIRFRREVEAIAQLRHPGVIQVFEVGESQGLIYCALEYADGGTLAAKWAGAPRPAREAAGVVEQLARGVQAAHAKGILHRDLKPTNVLLAGDGTAKIADFGLAKQIEDPAAHTAAGAILGTPAYIAPEQASGAAAAPAADIYGLGAILYEALTGRPPFKAETVLDTLRQVRDTEPIPPSRLNPTVPRDLETVCLKCLRKDPGKRYATAGDLAADLARFLEGRPVLARPAGVVERAAKWTRRKPALAALTLTSVLLFTVGLALVLFQWREAKRARAEEHVQRGNADNRAKEAVEAANGERREREGAERLAEWKAAEAYDATMILAHREWERGRLPRARQLLKPFVPAGPNQPDRRGFEWHYVDRLTRAELYAVPAASHTTIASTADGMRFAVGLGDDIVIRSCATGAVERTISSAHKGVRSVQFRADGKQLVSGGFDATVAIHDADTGRPAFVFREHRDMVANALFTPDGKRVVSLSVVGPKGPGELLLWEAATGKVVHRLGNPPTLLTPDLAVSPDGKRLYGIVDGRIERWDLESGQRLPPLSAAGDFWRLALSRDGTRLAVARKNTVTIFDADTGARQLVVAVGDATIQGLACSPVGDELAVGGSDSLLRLIDMRDGQLLRTIRGDGNPFRYVGFTGGKPLRVAGCSLLGTVKVWDARADAESRAVDLPGFARRLAVSGDGSRAATFQQGGDIVLYDLPTWTERRRVARPTGKPGLPNAICFSPRGDAVALVLHTGEVEFYADGAAAPPRTILAANGPEATCGAFSPDGRAFATGHRDGTILVHALSGEAVPVKLQAGEAEVSAIAFHPTDANVIAAVGHDPAARLWDIAAGKVSADLRTDSRIVSSVAFSPDGKQLATAGAPVILWDVATATRVVTLEGTEAGLSLVAFHPDGKRVAAAFPLTNTIMLFDTATGKETLSLKCPHPQTALFSNEGRTLTALGEFGRIYIYEAGHPVPPRR